MIAALSLGFALGVRHATDPDHVVAVTTIVSRERSVRLAGIVGAVWGLGHGITIFAVGGAVILFHVVIPPRLASLMELAVGVVLVVLGTTNLLGLRRPRVPSAAQARPSPGRPLARSLVVGIVHGLAGSAAVALLVLSTIREPLWALAYLFLFGAGTLAGMMVLTSVIAVPFAVAAGRFARLNRRMVQVASILSIALGILIAYRTA